VHEGIKRMETTAVSNIKNIEGECVKLCKENMHVWTELIEYMEMSIVETNLREVKQ
jgi:hypothetical protein